MAASKPDFTTPDFTTRDGRAIQFNFDAITIAEIRTLRDSKTPEDDEDAIWCKAAGISIEEFRQFSAGDYRRAWVAFFRAFRKPIVDDPDRPN